MQPQVRRCRFLLTVLKFFRHQQQPATFIIEHYTRHVREHMSFSTCTRWYCRPSRACVLVRVCLCAYFAGVCVRAWNRALCSTVSPKTSECTPSPYNTRKKSKDDRAVGRGIPRQDAVLKGMMSACLGVQAAIQHMQVCRQLLPVL